MGIVLTSGGGIVLGPGGGLFSTGAPTAPTDITLSNASVAETSADVVAANTVIGTLGAVGGTAPYTFSIQAGGAQFNISGTSLRAATGNTLTDTGSPYSVTVRVTDAASLTYDKAFSITVTDFVAAVQVTFFTMHNYGAAASPAIFTTGLTFKRGDIPAGSTIEVQRDDTGEVISCTLDAAKSWDDGSLMKAALNGIDLSADIAASGSRVYNVMRVSGSRSPAPSGHDPWSWLAAEDLKVELTGMQTSGGADMSPTQRDIVAATHAGVTTRREMFVDGRSQVVRWWGMAANDGHIQGTHYATIYRNASGTVLGARYVCRVGQGWYVADPLTSGESKDKRQYFATLKHGGTILASYFGDLANTVRIQHPYHSAWATVQKTGASGGRPWWIAGSEAREPTLWCEYDMAYQSQTGLLMDLDPSLSATASSLTTYDYTPLYGFGLKVGLPSGGDGSPSVHAPIFGVDSRRLYRQTRAIDRAWEMISLYSVHCPHFMRSHIVPTALGDISNRIIACQTQNSATSGAGYVGGEFAGLGERHRYARGNSGSTITYGSYSGGFATATVTWEQADTAHTPAIGYVAHLLTGHRIYLDAAVDNAMYMLWMWGTAMPWNVTGREVIYGNRQTTAGWVPHYFATCDPPDQTRGLAWSLFRTTQAWALAPDGSPEAAQLSETIDTTLAVEKWRIDSIKAQSSTIQKDRGIGAYRDNPNSQVWETHFLILATMFASNVYRSVNAVSAAKYYAKRPILMAASNYPLVGGSIAAEMLPERSEAYNPGVYDYAPYEAFSLQFLIRDASDTSLLLFTNTSYRNSGKPSVGDRIRFSVRSGVADLLPSPLVARTDYWIVAMPTAYSMRISDSPGGSPLSLGSVVNMFGWLIDAAAMLNKTDFFDPALDVAPNGTISYQYMYMNTLSRALKIAGVEVDGATLTTATTNARAIWDGLQGYVTTQAGSDANCDLQWWEARP